MYTASISLLRRSSILSKHRKSFRKQLEWLQKNNFREILIDGAKITFVYKYCLSEADLKQMLPEANSIIVNLHNWNGESCISKQAYSFARELNITLLTTEDFYGYIDEHKKQ